MGIFPVIKLGESFFDRYSWQAMPRSRAAALRTALCERAIHAVPPDIPPHASELRRGNPRVLRSDGAAADELGSWDQWESSPLGSPYTACIANQGSKVRELLLPAFRSSSRLRIIDPYFFPEPGSLVSTVFALAHDYVQLEVVCRVATEYPEFSAFARLGFDKKFQRVNSIAESLVEAMKEFDKNCRTRATGTTNGLQEVAWYLFGPGPKIHDRFLGFGSGDRTTDPRWLAASLGPGVRALEEELTQSCCVARISGQHLSEAWTEASGRCNWRVSIQAAHPQPQPDWVGSTCREGRWYKTVAYRRGTR